MRIDKLERIIIIGPTPPPHYGVSVATEIILKGLKDKFRVLHLDTSDRRKKLNFGKYDFGNIYLALRSIAVLLFYIITKRPKKVYLPISQAFPALYRDIAFILISKTFSKKIIIHLRGGYFKDFFSHSSKLKKLLIKFSLEKCDRFIVLGKSLKYIFEEFTDKNNISVVSNGVDTEFFRPLKNKPPNNEEINVVFISNLDEKKGWKEIVECAKNIKFNHKSIYKNIKFTIAGKWQDDKHKTHINKLLKDYGIDNIVEFIGPVDKTKKFEILSKADIFMMPTSYKYEGQPWVIIEAMAMRLPIITSDKGCISETVVNNLNGYIIKHNDIEGLTDALINLVRDGVIRQKMGEESRKRALNLFSEKIFLDNLIKAISNV